MIEFAGEDIARVVICEDKATRNPRAQIRNKVLPDFVNYESGARDNELIAAVATILSRIGIHEADQVVENILWDNQRAYRLAVTVVPDLAAPSAQGRLFKG